MQAWLVTARETGGSQSLEAIPSAVKPTEPMTEVRRRRRTGTSTVSNGDAPTEAPVEELDVTGRASASGGAPARETIDEKIVGEKSTALAMTMGALALGGFFLYLAFTTTIPAKDTAYAVMIDAGSSGTRAQVFSFQNGSLFETKMFSHDNPIAALGYAPGTGPAFFKPLLDQVRASIPSKKQQAKVPIALRATGGLRLVGIEFAERVMAEARKALMGSGFLVRKEWVSVIDAHAEGVGAWTSANFLRGHFNGSTTKAAHVAELGGASFQVVFEATDEALKYLEENPPDAKGASQTGAAAPRVVTMKGLKSDRKLISITRQGLGLADFKKKLYLVFDREHVLEEGNPCFRDGKVYKDKKILVGVTGSEEDRTVTINGAGIFENCVASAEITLGHFGPLDRKLLSHMKGSELFAYAYIYDRTVKLGLSESPSQDELVRKGKQLCEESDDSEDAGNWELCAEYSYVYLLLRELTNNFAADGPKINLVQYVDGHMLGWALGSVLNDFPQEILAQLE